MRLDGARSSRAVTVVYLVSGSFDQLGTSPQSKSYTASPSPRSRITAAGLRTAML